MIPGVKVRYSCDPGGVFLHCPQVVEPVNPQGASAHDSAVRRGLTVSLPPNSLCSLKNHKDINELYLMFYNGVFDFVLSGLNNHKDIIELYLIQTNIFYI